MQEAPPHAKESVKQSKQLNKYLSSIQNRKHVQNFKENNQAQLKNLKGNQKTEQTPFGNEVTNQDQVPKTFLANNGERVTVQSTHDFSLRDAKIFNTLYQSIQCNSSPEKQQLQLATNQE
jgi:hypothetical protein